MNTVIFTFVNVWAQIILGIFLALLLNSKIKGIRFFRSLLLYSYVIPTVATCMTFLWLFNPYYGIITEIMLKLGIWHIGISLFGDIPTAMLGTILVAVWKFTPFATILILARLMMIQPELYEAAWLDGASSFQMLRYITLPQLKGVVLTVMFIRTIWMFRNFDLIFVLTGGGPAKVTEILPILAYRYIFLTLDLSLGSTVLVLLFIVVFVYSICFLLVSRERRIT